MHLHKPDPQKSTRHGEIALMMRRGFNNLLLHDGCQHRICTHTPSHIQTHTRPNTACLERVETRKRCRKTKKKRKKKGIHTLENTKHAEASDKQGVVGNNLWKGRNSLCFSLLALELALFQRTLLKFIRNRKSQNRAWCCKDEDKTRKRERERVKTKSSLSFTLPKNYNCKNHSTFAFNFPQKKSSKWKNRKKNYCQNCLIPEDFVSELSQRE